MPVPGCESISLAAQARRLAARASSHTPAQCINVASAALWTSQCPHAQTTCVIYCMPTCLAVVIGAQTCHTSATSCMHGCQRALSCFEHSVSSKRSCCATETTLARNATYKQWMTFAAAHLGALLLSEAHVSSPALGLNASPNPKQVWGHRKALEAKRNTKVDKTASKHSRSTLNDFQFNSELPRTKGWPVHSDSVASPCYPVT
jgi:hypothetical protein